MTLSCFRSSTGFKAYIKGIQCWLFTVRLIRIGNRILPIDQRGLGITSQNLLFFFNKTNWQCTSELRILIKFCKMNTIVSCSLCRLCENSWGSGENPKASRQLSSPVLLWVKHTDCGWFFCQHSSVWEQQESCWGEGCYLQETLSPGCRCNLPFSVQVNWSIYLYSSIIFFLQNIVSYSYQMF